MISVPTAKIQTQTRTNKLTRKPCYDQSRREREDDGAHVYNGGIVRFFRKRECKAERKRKRR